MSENTKIEWATHTFNAWEGCTKVGAGCDHCYAEVRNARYAGGQSVNWGVGAPRRRTSEANWKLPIKWNKEADAFFAEHGHRQRVFCSSLADVFDNEVDPQWRHDLFALIQKTPNLDWLLLTKRIGNVPKLVDLKLFTELPNIWLGATVVNQAEADRDIPKLLDVPAYIKFLSIEPLLGAIDLTAAYLPCPNFQDTIMDPTTGAYECCSRCDFTGVGSEMGIDWVIVGGESGNGARPMHPDWVRNLRDQCKNAGVPFLFKQWGEYAPATAGLYYYPLLETSDFQVRANGKDCHNFGDGYGAVKIGKHKAGRLLDGVTHDGFPNG